MIQSAKILQKNQKKKPHGRGKNSAELKQFSGTGQMLLCRRIGTWTQWRPERSHDPDKHIHDISQFLEVGGTDAISQDSEGTRVFRPGQSLLEKIFLRTEHPHMSCHFQ